ncbi:MAG TPA: urease accessory protein UreD [Verrucomicrobiae bacterium]|nr:urease accessory protein UreD [Verrucomicrobiae bacterium]
MTFTNGERGRAVLQIEQIFNQSTITGSFATSPMKLLSPRSRGPCVCSYVSNFGGGLVAGDQTRLHVRVGRSARCFIGTQSSTKVYRNPQGLPCEHITTANIESDALLVFAPSPVQPFAESTYDQKQHFTLAAGAGLALLDWFTAGRSACGERWKFSHFSTRNEVWRKPPGNESPDDTCDATHKEPVFFDAYRLDSKDGPIDAPHRAGRFNCFAMLALIGSPLKRAAERVLKEIGRARVKPRDSLLVSASPIKDGAVLRLAGIQLSEVEQSLRRHLGPVADALGEDPWSRKW